MSRSGVVLLLALEGVEIHRKIDWEEADATVWAPTWKKAPRVSGRDSVGGRVVEKIWLVSRNGVGKLQSSWVSNAWSWASEGPEKVKTNKGTEIYESHWFNQMEYEWLSRIKGQWLMRPQWSVCYTGFIQNVYTIHLTIHYYVVWHLSVGLLSVFGHPPCPLLTIMSHKFQYWFKSLNVSCAPLVSIVPLMISTLESVCGHLLEPHDFRSGRADNIKQNKINYGKLIPSGSTLPHVPLYLVCAFSSSVILFLLIISCNRLQIPCRDCSQCLCPPIHRHDYLSVCKSMSWSDASRVHRSYCTGGESEELEISCNWKNKRDTCWLYISILNPAFSGGSWIFIQCFYRFVLFGC